MLPSALPAQTHQKPRLPWTIVHVVKNDLYCIEISRLPLRMPKFSYRVLSNTKNKQTGEDATLPFISLQLENAELGTVRIKGKHPSELLYNLMQQAEDWVVTAVANTALASLNERIERETQQANRDKQVTRHTGKTERDRQKRVGK